MSHNEDTIHILGVYSLPLVSCYESQLTWNNGASTSRCGLGLPGLLQRGPALRTLPVCAGEAAGGRRARHEFFIAIDCRCTVATLQATLMAIQ